MFQAPVVPTKYGNESAEGRLIKRFSTLSTKKLYFVAKDAHIELLVARLQPLHFFAQTPLLTFVPSNCFEETLYNNYCVFDWQRIFTG